MIRILVVEPPGLNGVNWWRIHEPFMNLTRDYPGQFEVRRTGKQVTNEELMYCDIFFCSRPCTDSDVKILGRAKEFGCKVLLDFDDDILHLPIGHTLFMDFASFTEHIEACMKLADWIWTSTEPIQYVADALGRSTVIKNAVTHNRMRKAALAPYEKTAAWRGTHAQFHDLYHEREFFAKYHKVPEKWYWLGYIPPYDEVVQTNFQGIVWKKDTAGYFFNLHKLKCNWLWKPMKPCPFNDSKSNIAWIEATISGGVCVAPSYAGKPTWEYAWSEIIDDYDAITKTWQESYDVIMQDYNLKDQNRIRYESLLSLHESPTSC